MLGLELCCGAAGQDTNRILNKSKSRGNPEGEESCYSLKFFELYKLQVPIQKLCLK